MKKASKAYTSQFKEEGKEEKEEESHEVFSLMAYYFSLIGFFDTVSLSSHQISN